MKIKGDRMKKMKKLLLGNIKTVVAFILGIIISGTTVYAATILFNANQVGYDNTSSGMSATNVQEALDELYTKANTYINPSDFGIQRNTAKTVMATPGGVCIKRNGTVHCFGTNNWTYEKDHIQQVFSDVSCFVDSSSVDCNASDFYCFVDSDGYVNCDDSSVYSRCIVDPDGSVDCT